MNCELVVKCECLLHFSEIISHDSKNVQKKVDNNLNWLTFYPVIAFKKCRFQEWKITF